MIQLQMFVGQITLKQMYRIKQRHCKDCESKGELMLFSRMKFNCPVHDLIR
jgi:hypothetical protein